MVRKKINFRKLSQDIAVLGEEKFGSYIIILDARLLTAAADFIVLISVFSHPQMNAVSRHISDALKQRQIGLLRKEFPKGANWAVHDYGGVIVHIMLQECRDFYKIERLWLDAKKVRWGR